MTRFRERRAQRANKILDGAKVRLDAASAKVERFRPRLGRRLAAKVLGVTRQQVDEAAGILSRALRMERRMLVSDTIRSKAPRNAALGVAELGATTKMLARRPFGK